MKRELTAEERATAKQRGKENTEKILLWVYRWGWTTDRVLQQLVNVQRLVGGELCRRGVLQRVDAPAGHHTAYVINSASLSRALELYEDDTLNNAIPYPWPATSVPFSALGEHQEQAQLEAIRQLRLFPDAQLRVDRELRIGTRGAVPDFQIIRMNGKWTEWHEVELTPKYQERLWFQLQERETARAAGKFTQVFFWCRTLGIGRQLQTAIRRPTVPEVFRRGDGKIAAVSASQQYWSPVELRKRCEVLMLGDDRTTTRDFGTSPGCQASLYDDKRVIDDL